MNEEQKNILICGTPTIITWIIIKKLLKHNISFIGYQDIRQYEQIKEKLGDNSFLFNKSLFYDKQNNNISLFFRIVFKQCYDIVIIFGNRNIINSFFLLFHRIKHIKIIYFPYDIVDSFFEKLCIKYSDKLVTKNIFNNLVIKNDIVDKKPVVDFNNVKLVFIGGVFDGNYNIFKKLAEYKNIEIHVYPSNIFYFKNIEKHNSIIIHSYIKDHKKLIQEISNYDFGLILIDTELYKNIKNSSTMKMFDYLGANLPIIINSEYIHMAKIIEDNDFGIIVNDVNKINEQIEICNYKFLINSVKRNRIKFFDSGNIL